MLYVQNFPLRFTGKVVTLAQSAVGGRDESAATLRGGGFADYAVVSRHCLRIYLEKSYRDSLGLLSEMPQILGEIGRVEADLPDHSTLVKAFDRIKMTVWRVLLRLYYCRRTNYRVQTLKTTALVDTDTQAVLEFTVRPRNDTTLSSAGNSPATMRASCTASQPAKATTGSNYVRNCGKKA